MKRWADEWRLHGVNYSTSCLDDRAVDRANSRLGIARSRRVRVRLQSLSGSAGGNLLRLAGESRRQWSGTGFATGSASMNCTGWSSLSANRLASVAMRSSPGSRKAAVRATRSTTRSPSFPARVEDALGTRSGARRVAPGDHPAGQSYRSAAAGILMHFARPPSPKPHTFDANGLIRFEDFQPSRWRKEHWK